MNARFCVADNGETARELEKWLRDEANERIKRAASRRTYAHAGDGLTDADREAGHRIAEQMMGRNLPRRTRAEDARTARIEVRIASKLEEEAAMLLRFADWVATGCGEVKQ